MKTLLIVYHSQSGACLRLASAARRGARREQDCGVVWRRAWDAGTADLLHCDALLLVGAENSGSVAGAIKDFLDRTYYPVQAAELHLPCALLLSAGNDGRGAERQLQRILSGYPMRLVAQPVLCRGAVTAQHEQASEELGQTLAAGLSLGIF